MQPLPVSLLENSVSFTKCPGLDGTLETHLASWDEQRSRLEARLLWPLSIIIRVKFRPQESKESSHRFEITWPYPS